MSRRPHHSSRKVLWRRYSRLAKVIIGILVIFGIVFGVYLLLFRSDKLRIDSINIEGAHNFVSKEDLNAMATQSLDGEYFFSIDEEEIESTLESNFQGAKEIEIEVSVLGKVEVLVKERQPLALVTNTTDEHYLVDEDGYLLGVVDPDTTNMPIIRYEGDLQVGYFIDPDLVPLYLDLLRSLDESQIKASSISVTRDYVNFYIDGPVEIFIGRSKDIAVAVDVLSSLVEQLRFEGNNVKKIDLRYDKVVVE